MKLRKWAIIMLLTTLLAVPVGGMTDKADAQSLSIPLTIVRDGQPHAVVLVEDDADVQIKKAADILVDYVQKSTGAVLPIMTEDELQSIEGRDMNHALISIDHSDAEGKTNTDARMEGMDDHGFLIRLNQNRVTITGPTVWGALNGVHDFLERYVGVRWLMPGPDGEDVPRLSHLSIPREEIREEPAFSYRVVSPMAGTPDQPGERQLLNEWAQRNRLQGNYNWSVRFMHNLYALFPPEKFGSTHPEFYKDGIPPEPGIHTAWQPCFTVEGTVKAAAAEIITFFDNHPDENTFSLGVNDSGGYCEADPTHPSYPGAFNSIGLVHMSDIYYQWVNEVISLVTEVYPDKVFGVLAYQEVMDPPSFPLHPQVVPFLTKDRLTWIDEDIKAVGSRQLEQWKEVTSQLHWYDYMYGTLYVLPRIYPHVMSDNYEYAKQQEVRGAYTEMYPNAGDGPKAWLSAKLQWNPEQDVDELLQEWYVRAVGLEAAPYLAEYYEIWEQFWTERIKESSWFEVGKGHTYLPFADGSYMNLVTDNDIDRSRLLMNQVVDKAETAEQRARALKLHNAFSYYEASALSYPKQAEPLHDETEALGMLAEINDTMEARLELASSRHDWIEQFKNDPALWFVAAPRVDWTGWNKSEFWHLVDYLKDREEEGGPVTAWLEEKVQHSESSRLRNFYGLLLDVAGGVASLTDNSSFESHREDGSALAWQSWIVSSGSMGRVEGISHSGEASWHIANLDRGGPHQTFAVEPGLLTAKLYFYTPPGTMTNGTIQLLFNLKNAQGQNLGNKRSELVPFSATTGEWASMEYLEEIPEYVNSQQVKQVQVIATVNNGQEAQVYIDDFVVYQ